MAQDFRELGQRLSNWGRWGAEDERGTLNFITAETVLAAKDSIRSGKVFELSLPLGAVGPQVGGGGRFNPIHTMTILPGDFNAPDSFLVTDDAIFMPEVRHWPSSAMPTHWRGRFIGAHC